MNGSTVLGMCLQKWVIMWTELAEGWVKKKWGGRLGQEELAVGDWDWVGAADGGRAPVV